MKSGSYYTHDLLIPNPFAYFSFEQTRKKESSSKKKSIPSFLKHKYQQHMLLCNRKLHLLPIPLTGSPFQQILLSSISLDGIEHTTSTTYSTHIDWVSKTKHLPFLLL